MNRDKCKQNSDEWGHCNVCNGRIHRHDCTSTKKRGKDCLDNHTPEELEAAGYGPAEEHRRFQSKIKGL